MASPVDSIGSFNGCMDGDDDYFLADEYFKDDQPDIDLDHLDMNSNDGLNNIEIDMDGIMDMVPDIKPDIKPIGTSKPPPKKIIITKKSNTTSGKIDKNPESDVRIEIDSGKPLKKVDECLEINPETIDFYSKDIQLNRDCCKKSLCRNDTGVICLLLKLGFIKDYRCSNKKCKIAKTWLDKQIQLLLNRKNGKFDDLTPSNLELLCPNCYMITYGMELFMKMIDKTVYKCKVCQYPLNNCGGKRKKSGYCQFCENKMISTVYHKHQTEYLAELNDANDPSANANTMAPDNFSSTAYYNEVSKFKSFKPINGNDSEKSKLSKLATKPIIKLNMNVPDLADLIDEQPE